MRFLLHHGALMVQIPASCLILLYNEVFLLLLMVLSLLHFLLLIVSIFTHLLAQLFLPNLNLFLVHLLLLLLSFQVTLQFLKLMLDLLLTVLTDHLDGAKPVLGVP